MERAGYIGRFIKCCLFLKKTLMDLFVAEREFDDEFEYTILDLESKDKKLLNNFARKRWKIDWVTSTIDWEKQETIMRVCLKRKLALSKTDIIVQLYEEMKLLLCKS